MMDDIQKRGDGIVMQTLKQLLGSLDLLNEQKQQQLIGQQAEIDRLKAHVHRLEEESDGKSLTIAEMTREMSMLKAKLVVDAASS